MTLENYTTVELLAEIALRADKKKREDAQDRSDLLWCDECVHWKSATSFSELKYNPCQKKQTMHFINPRDLSDIEWGHYRRKCMFRQQIPELTKLDESDPYAKDRKSTPPARTVPVGVP